MPMIPESPRRGSYAAPSGGNPVKNDPKLIVLLERLKLVDSYEQFQNWRQEFLDRFEFFLGEAGAAEANKAYEDFRKKRMETVVKKVHRVSDMRESGGLSPDRVSVKARNAMNELSVVLIDTAKDVQALVPPTSAEEIRQGYTKYNLGAVLVRDGFQEYERMQMCKDVMDRLKEECIDAIGDEKMLTAIRKYNEEVSRFVSIMEDLGLYEIMIKSREFDPKNRDVSTTTKPEEKQKERQERKEEPKTAKDSVTKTTEEQEQEDKKEEAPTIPDLPFSDSRDEAEKDGRNDDDNKSQVSRNSKSPHKKKYTVGGTWGGLVDFGNGTPASSPKPKGNFSSSRKKGPEDVFVTPARTSKNKVPRVKNRETQSMSSLPHLDGADAASSTRGGRPPKPKNSPTIEGDLEESDVTLTTPPPTTKINKLEFVESEKIVSPLTSPTMKLHGSQETDTTPTSSPKAIKKHESPKDEFRHPAAFPRKVKSDETDAIQEVSPGESPEKTIEKVESTEGPESASTDGDPAIEDLGPVEESKGIEPPSSPASMSGDKVLGEQALCPTAGSGKRPQISELLQGIDSQSMGSLPPKSARETSSLYGKMPRRQSDSKPRETSSLYGKMPRRQSDSRSVDMDTPRTRKAKLEWQAVKSAPRMNDSESVAGSGKPKKGSKTKSSGSEKKSPKKPPRPPVELKTKTEGKGWNLPLCADANPDEVWCRARSPTSKEKAKVQVTTRSTSPVSNGLENGQNRPESGSRSSISQDGVGKNEENEKSNGPFQSEPTGNDTIADDAPSTPKAEVQSDETERQNEGTVDNSFHLGSVSESNHQHGPSTGPERQVVESETLQSVSRIDTSETHHKFTIESHSITVQSTTIHVEGYHNSEVANSLKIGDSSENLLEQREAQVDSEDARDKHSEEGGDHGEIHAKPGTDPSENRLGEAVAEELNGEVLQSVPHVESSGELIEDQSIECTDLDVKTETDQILCAVEAPGDLPKDEIEQMEVVEGDEDIEGDELIEGDDSAEPWFQPGTLVRGNPLIRCLTFCSVDDTVDPKLLGLICSCYPMVEFAVLMRPGMEGQPRYASQEWIQKLAMVQKRCGGRMRLAAHLCGEYADEVLRGGDSILKKLAGMKFRRVQLNVGGLNSVKTRDIGQHAQTFLSVIKKHPELEIALQGNKESLPLWEEILATGKLPRNIAMLFDESKGSGVVPDSWPPAPKSFRVGYAGGIGLGGRRVTKMLFNDIIEAGKGQSVWVSMESSMRSTRDGKDIFDIAKCYEIIDIAHECDIFRHPTFLA